MNFIGKELTHLIQIISKFPGLGPRSAKRIALYLAKQKGSYFEALIHNLSYIKQHLRPCSICSYLDEREPCFFCTSPARLPASICVVADIGDVWAIEKAGFFKGRYHVLGGLLSSFEGWAPQELQIEKLLHRLDDSVSEVILALNTNIEGQSTLYYLSEHIALKCPNIKISSLAKGMPVGSELDYLDQGTLISAFIGRKHVTLE